jgi:DNA polymerase-3 subunit delta
LKLSGASIRRYLDKPDPTMRAALLFGPNSSLVFESAQKLVQWAMRGADGDYGLTRLGEDEIKRDAARLADALAAQSMFGGPTVVWARVDGKGADAAILDALKQIEAGAPGGFLVVEGGDLGGSSALAKAFNEATRAVGAVFYEESDADRAGFARELLAELKVSLDRDAQELLMRALPSDRGLARREIEKLALYAHDLGRPISQADLDALIADEADSALDQAGAAAMAGRAAEAVETLARVENLAGVSAIRALERKLMQLLDARALMDQGASPTEAVSKLRPPVFWKERDTVAAQARSWAPKKITAALDLLWTAELRAKTAGSPQELIAADVFRAVAKLAPK